MHVSQTAPNSFVARHVVVPSWQMPRFLFARGPGQHGAVLPAGLHGQPCRFLSSGQSGVPPCGPTTGGTTVCDTQETGFANGGRNIFRGDSQKRADLSLYKVTRITERSSLRLGMDVFNITNTPSFDTPGNNFTGSDFGNPPNYLPLGPGADPLTFANQGVGAVTNPLGGPRQIQFTGLITF